MKVRSEADDWCADGPKILSPENLEIIGNTLENDGPVILEHWHYRGGRSPNRFVFDDLDALVDHVQNHSSIGDAFQVWSFAAVCTDQNMLASGKLPDEDGCVPRKGAY